MDSEERRFPIHEWVLGTFDDDGVEPFKHRVGKHERKHVCYAKNVTKVHRVQVVPAECNHGGLDLGLHEIRREFV